VCKVPVHTIKTYREVEVFSTNS